MHRVTTHLKVDEGGSGQALPGVFVGGAVPAERAVDPDGDTAAALDEVPYSDGG